MNPVTLSTWRDIRYVTYHPWTIIVPAGANGGCLWPVLMANTFLDLLFQKQPVFLWEAFNLMHIKWNSQPIKSRLSSIKTIRSRTRRVLLRTSFGHFYEGFPEASQSKGNLRPKIAWTSTFLKIKSSNGLSIWKIGSFSSGMPTNPIFPLGLFTRIFKFPLFQIELPILSALEMTTC